MELEAALTLLREFGPAGVGAVALIYIAFLIRKYLSSQPNPSLGEHLSRLERGQTDQTRILSGLSKETHQSLLRTEDIWKKVNE